MVKVLFYISVLHLYKLQEKMKVQSGVFLTLLIAQSHLLILLCLVPSGFSKCALMHYFHPISLIPPFLPIQRKGWGTHLLESDGKIT